MGHMELGILAERYEQDAYVLNGITYLPHYTDAGCFVCPGYGRETWDVFTVPELERAGAMKEKRFLLKRAWD